MVYEIRIDEEQRALLTEALRSHKLRWPGDEEVRTLFDMFQDLPKQEAEAPGNVHGFCL